MSGDIEATLQELNRVMDEHRRVLGGAVARPDPAVTPPVRGDDPTPSGSDPRQAALDRLMANIETRIGLRAVDTVGAKPARSLTSVATVEVIQWVDRMRELPTEHPDWLALVESLTVHESYLFRDPQQLEVAAQWLGQSVQAARDAGGARILRLWSAGCAAGEEAYTLALLAFAALQDAGLAVDSARDGFTARTGWGVDVLGTDLSRAVLRTAETGIYTTGRLSAFRDLPQAYNRFFETGPARGTRVARADLRRAVRFRQANLVAPPPEQGFDLVACRNVLIYMDQPARLQVLRHLTSALKPGGILMLGPTDVLAEPHGLAAFGGETVGVFRKAGGNG